jgi:hypothetical protein
VQRVLHVRPPSLYLNPPVCHFTIPVSFRVPSEFYIAKVCDQLATLPVAFVDLTQVSGLRSSHRCQCSQRRPPPKFLWTNREPQTTLGTGSVNADCPCASCHADHRNSLQINQLCIGSGPGVGCNIFDSSVTWRHATRLGYNQVPLYSLPYWSPQFHDHASRWKARSLRLQLWCDCFPGLDPRLLQLTQRQQGTRWCTHFSHGTN